jgi:acyl carrier protein
MSVNNDKLKSILARVLDIEKVNINDNTSPENTESWDSFNALLLVTELETEFDVQFTMEEVYAVKCVRDIKMALSSHGVLELI